MRSYKRDTLAPPLCQHSCPDNRTTKRIHMPVQFSSKNHRRALPSADERETRGGWMELATFSQAQVQIAENRSFDADPRETDSHRARLSTRWRF